MYLYIDIGTYILRFLWYVVPVAPGEVALSPGEVALSCNPSYWEARIGDGLSQQVLIQPRETRFGGRTIPSPEMGWYLINQDPGIPGSWLSRG
jgi:hypothetical protein